MTQQSSADEVVINEDNNPELGQVTYPKAVEDDTVLLEEAYEAKQKDGQGSDHSFLGLTSEAERCDSPIIKDVKDKGILIHGL